MRTSTARTFGQRDTSLSGPTPLRVVAETKSRRKSINDLKAVEADQRKYRRIRVRLSGRFMREDRQEYACYTNDISAGGMNVSAPVNCEPGEYLVFYIQEIGRIEGYVVRNHDDGFAIAIEASRHKREKLVATLTWILNRHELNGIEARRHERHIPARRHTVLIREDGTEIPVEVLDLSLGGARVNINANLNSGEKIRLGKSSGYVVRTGTEGTAIQFDTEQSPQIFESMFS